MNKLGHSIAFDGRIKRAQGKQRRFPSPVDPVCSSGLRTLRFSCRWGSSRKRWRHIRTNEIRAKLGLTLRSRGARQKLHALHSEFGHLHF